jgi:hypothetical protein
MINAMRDEIRMASGSVIITDPIRPIERTEAREPDMDMFDRLNPLMQSAMSFIIVPRYDNLSSAEPANSCLINIDQIESITTRIVQFEEGELG